MPNPNIVAVLTSLNAIQDIVSCLFDHCLSVQPHARSADFKCGVKAALDSQIAGTVIRHHYVAGTVQLDAFLCGFGEGSRAVVWYNSVKGV